MATADEKLDALTEVVAALAAEQKRTGDELKRLNDFMLDFRTEVIQRFDLIDTRLDVLDGVARSHSVLFASFTKATTNFGAIANQLMKSDAELKRRVDALEKPAA